MNNTETESGYWRQSHEKQARPHPAPWPDDDEMQGRVPARTYARKDAATTSEGDVVGGEVDDGMDMKMLSTEEGRAMHDWTVPAFGHEAGGFPTGDAYHEEAFTGGLDRRVPGATVVYGVDEEAGETGSTTGRGNDVDAASDASPPTTALPDSSPPITARAVHPDEERQVLRQQLREVLAERDRENAVEAHVAVTSNVDLPGDGHSLKHKRLIIAGGILIVIAIVIAVILGVLLPSDEPPGPAPPLGPVELIDLISSVSSDGGVAVRTTGTPQNDAFNWLAIDENLRNYSNQRRLQRYSLATLFYGTDGLSWKQNGGWLYNDDECFWERLFCVNGTVIHVDLTENRVRLTIPPEIGLLTSLDRHSLADNNLTGPIPTDVGRLTKLEGLFFWGNELNETIPTEISELTALKLLHLYENMLSGPIPTGITDLTNLEELWLEKNRLTGRIPDDIGKLTKLTTLWFHSNRLTGTIPTNIHSLTNLDALLIYNNSFTGSFTCPDFIQDCLVSCNSSADPSCRSL